MMQPTVTDRAVGPRHPDLLASGCHATHMPMVARPPDAEVYSLPDLPK